MGNGYTPEQMLDRIEAHVLRVEGKVDGIVEQALPQRVKDLEGWRNRGIGGVIVSLLSAVGALILAIGNHLASGK